MAKTFKIYGTAYPLEQTTDSPPDAFGFKNEVVDDQPTKAKLAGYVTMEDGSVVECYTKFNPLVIVIPILVAALVAGGGCVYLLKGQPKDVNVGDVLVQTGDDNNVVQYNGFMSLQNGTVDVDFTNGEQEATITLTADGIECETVTVAPNEYVEEIPVTFTTDEGLVQATLTITTSTSTASQQVVIEIPENNTANSPNSGLDGYWKGEAVYGTDPTSVE